MVISGVAMATPEDPLYSHEDHGMSAQEEHPVLVQPQEDIAEGAETFEVSTGGNGGMGRHNKTRKGAAKKSKNKSGHKLHKEGGDDSIALLDEPKRVHMDHPLLQEVIGPLVVTQEDSLLSHISHEENSVVGFQENPTIFS